jgi:nitrogen-specific signal transduction histidine kinase
VLTGPGNPVNALATLELLDTAIIRLDESGMIVHMNAAAEQCVLVGRERAQGSHIGNVAIVPEALLEAIEGIRTDQQGRRLHELRLGEGLFDCTIQRIDDGTLMNARAVETQPGSRDWKSTGGNSGCRTDACQRVGNP